MTKFFLKNKVLLLTLTTLLFIGGIFAYFNLPRNEDPGFKIRTAVITTPFKSANAGQVDLYLTQKLEEEMEQIGEIEHVRSTSRNGVSVIYVDIYEKFTNLQPIFDKIRRRVDTAQVLLPTGAKSIVDDEFGDVYGVIVTVSGKDFSYKELKDISDKVKDELLKLSQVAKIQVEGDVRQVLYLTYDNATLEKYHISSDLLEFYLSKTNLISTGGDILVNGNNISIYFDENFTTLSDAKNTQVTLIGGDKNVSLGDIFNVTLAYENPPRIIVQHDGTKAIALGISMKENGNIFLLGQEIKEAIKSTQNHLPIGINLDIVAFQPDYVKNLTSKFTTNLAESILIVVVLILAILGARMGMIVGFIIPVTVFSALFFMEKLNIGLDKISLSALIISLGILVDNSIVIAEGFLQELKENENGKMDELLISTCKKFQAPLLVSTLITSSAFLPIYLAQSQVSEYTSSLFKVVALTLLLSWFFSIAFLPFLIKYFYKKADGGLIGKLNLAKFFSVPLKFSLNNPKKALKIALLVLFVSFIFFNFVPKIFFPDSDRNMFEVKITLPSGTDIYETKKVVDKIENYMENLKGIVDFSSYIGASAPRYVLSATPETPRSNYAMILANTTNYKIVGKLIEEIQIFCNKNFTDANIIARKVPLGPPYDAPVEIRIYGDDISEITGHVRKIQEELRKIKYVTFVEDDWGQKVANIGLKLDRATSIRRGITNGGIAQSLKSAFDGNKVSSFYDGKNSIDIVYKMDEKMAKSISDIDEVNLYSPIYGATFPLSEIAKLSLNFEYPELYRRDGALVVTIKAQINKEKTTANAVIKKITPTLKKIKFPLGYGYEIGGSVESSKKGNKSIAEKLPLAGGIILLILIGYFNSIKKPTIIALVAFLAISGANIGLLITGSYFGFMTFLGYICLIGIATNNCVVLVDFIDNQVQEKGGVVTKLIVQTATKKRITPICLTALTTIGGMLPLWLGGDPMFSSLAIAIIFGLLTSVIATLVVAPALYLVWVKKN